MEPLDLIKKIDEAIETLPEEVRSFLFDGEFAAVFEPYKTKYADQEKFLGIKNKTLECILGVAQVAEVKSYVEQHTQDKQLADALKKDIQEKIIDEILLLIEVYQEMQGVQQIPQTNTVGHQVAMNRLSQSFTTPTTITPTKRVYTDLPSTSSSSAPSPSTKPAVDPYRIDPNEK